MDACRVLLVCAGILCGWMVAGATVSEADEVPYRHFTTFDGLPGEHVTALIQTPSGLLWVGTGKGLAVYDGHEFRQISFPDSLGTAYVYSMAVGPDGSVWVSPSMGVVAKVGTNGIERVLSLGNGTYVRQILSRKKRVVFLGTSEYWTLEAGAKSPVRHPYQYETMSIPEIEEGAGKGVGIFDAALDPNGRIWVLDGRLGPGRLHSDGSVSFVEAKYGTPGDFWYEIGFAEDGSGVLTKGRRLLHLNPDSHKFTEVTDQLGDPTYLSVDNSVAYATRDHTILRYDVDDARMQTPFGPGVGLPETMPRTVLRGREGALWIGTRDGLVQVMNPNVRVLGSVDGNSLYNVHSFAASDEALWARTHGAGLVQLLPERGLARPDGIVEWEYDIQGRDGFLHALASNSRIWMRWHASTGWKQVRKVASAIGGVVLEDGVGYFRHPDGLYRYSPEPERRPDRLISWSAENDDTRLAPARGKTLLLQKNERLFRVDTPSGIVLDTLGRLPNPQQGTARSLGVGPRSLAMDDRGHIWSTNPQGGLSRLDPATGDRQTILNSVPTWNVRALGDSLILVTSRERGLYLVEATTGEVQQHLTQADGLKSNEVLDAHMQADTLYVAHSRGITLFPRKDLYRKQSSPSVILRGLEAGLSDRPLSPDTIPKLKERRIGISYTAPSLSHAAHVTYQVRLGGQEEGARDTDWETTSRRFIRYTNLEPGTYRFEVRARLGDAPPGPRASYAFTIRPHFYETGWFQLLVALGLIGLGVGAYRWRIYRLRRRQEELETAVEARTETLRERTEDLAAEKEKTEEQTERLAELDEAKNRFFAHISHEFRTPLSLILTPLEEAVEHAATDTVTFGKRHVERMLRNARRLQRLIERLLDLATLEAGRMELDRQPGDLHRFVRRSVEAFASMADRNGVDLQVRTSGETLRTRFDPEKIESIVNNLLSNALKFTPEGGRVTVWLGERTPSSPRDDGEAREAILKVADTGPGMVAETQARIFERFEHVDASDTREHEGAGLGLALTKELVDLHGGTIEVESTPGEGTTFTVALPFRPKTAEEAPEDEPTADPASPADEPAVHADADRPLPAGDGVPSEGDAGATTEATVLIVEDNAEMRAYLREQLPPHWKIWEAANGETGWQAVQERNPDLVLSDVMMPGLSGYELCEKIKDDPDLRGTPVLLLTARAGTDDAIEGLDCGADDYVPKPFDVDELRRRIENHLAAREHLRDRYREQVRLEALGTVVDEDEVSFLEAVTAAVETHLSDPDFAVEQLAQAAALSRRQLTRRLKGAMGQTPAAFIRARRMERAKEMLVGEAETVAEVAHAVGFRSPSAFSKAFRKHVGHPPSEHVEQAG